MGGDLDAPPVGVGHHAPLEGGSVVDGNCLLAAARYWVEGET
jgi:hypothetical protein